MCSTEEELHVSPERRTIFLAAKQQMQSTYAGLLESSNVHVHEPNAHSMLIVWQGKQPALPALLTYGHYDVVPVDADSRKNWQQGPFGGVIHDGCATTHVSSVYVRPCMMQLALPTQNLGCMHSCGDVTLAWTVLKWSGCCHRDSVCPACTCRAIWGRGALDMKGPLIAQLEAWAYLHKRGFRPERTMAMGIGHDEEVGGTYGAKQLAQTLENLALPIGLVWPYWTRTVAPDLRALCAPSPLTAVCESLVFHMATFTQQV